MQSKNYKILNSNRGASLIFVLCMMLFLITVGISILSVSVNGAGMALERKTEQQLEILCESLVKSFTASLKQEGSVGDAIVKDVIEMDQENTDFTRLEKDIVIGLLDMESAKGSSELKLSFSDVVVTITTVEPEDDSGEETVETKVSFNMVAKVIVVLNGQKLACQARYRYKEGVFIGDSISNRGKWSMSSYEKIEN